MRETSGGMEMFLLRNAYPPWVEYGCSMGGKLMFHGWKVDVPWVEYKRYAASE
ncbi:UNVERIFIED_CONTAM: hypothetical protein NY100_09185 [Prevotella sp. 15_C9]